MRHGELLGYPEISYFPHNPEGMRAVMISPGAETWHRRLARIWTTDNVRYQVDLLLRKRAASIAKADSVNVNTK